MNLPKSTRKTPQMQDFNSTATQQVGNCAGEFLLTKNAFVAIIAPSFCDSDSHISDASSACRPLVCRIVGGSLVAILGKPGGRVLLRSILQNLPSDGPALLPSCRAQTRCLRALFLNLLRVSADAPGALSPRPFGKAEGSAALMAWLCHIAYVAGRLPERFRYSL